jgi:hypothetical protein
MSYSDVVEYDATITDGPIPPLKWLYVGLGTNFFVSVVNSALIFEPGALATNTCLATFFGALTILHAKVFIPHRIAERNAWRKAMFEKWLEKPVPELQPYTDWAEIERAIGNLLEEDVEPTIERARDWLLSDSLRERAKKHREATALAAKRARARRLKCKHEDTEIYSTHRGYEVICTDCGSQLADGVTRPFDRSSDEALLMEAEELKKQILVEKSRYYNSNPFVRKRSC